MCGNVKIYYDIHISSNIENANMLPHASPSLPSFMPRHINMLQSDNFTFPNLPSICFSLHLRLTNPFYIPADKRLHKFCFPFLYCINFFTNTNYSYFGNFLFFTLILFSSLLPLIILKSIYLIVSFSCSLISISGDINFLLCCFCSCPMWWIISLSKL